MRKFTKYPQGYVKADTEQLTIYDMPDPNQVSIDDLNQTSDEDELGTRMCVEFDYNAPISMKELVSCIESVSNKHGYSFSSFFIADHKNEMINDYNERGFSEWADEDMDYDAYIDFTCDGDIAGYGKLGDFHIYIRDLVRSLNQLGCSVVNIFHEYGW